MEAKLNQKQQTPFLRSRIQTTPNPKLPHSFCLNSCENQKKSLTKRFRKLAERWNFVKVGGLSKGYCPTKHLSVHVVKEGETLALISRQYGVSIQEIAMVNAEIVDVDLVLEGQRLNIPISAKKMQMGTNGTNWLDHSYMQNKYQRTLDILRAHKNHQIFTLPSSHHLQLAKPTGYFLVLVPLIAFCIRCIIGTFRHRVAKYLKHQGADELKTHHYGSRSMRWKSVLSDIREPENVDAETMQDSDNPPKDQLQVPFEEVSRSYTKLEPAYQKFLSECGMSNWGYWRGGSPE